MRKIILIVHNVRSCHNVGSLLRTAEGLGAEKVYLTGFTPYPIAQNDPRLPHVAASAARQIHKTALGAELNMLWEHAENLQIIIQRLRTNNWQVVALEQAKDATDLPDYKPPGKLAIIVGREVEGIESEVLALTDECLSIPMLGQKESFNVAQAAAMALYHCRYCEN